VTSLPRAALRSALIPPLLALSWGLNWPAVRIMLGVLPPFTLRLLGLGLGALLLFALAAARRIQLWPERDSWPFVLLGGVFTVAGFNVCTAFAQLATTTSRAAVLTFTMPMMVALLAWIVMGERPGKRGAWALLLGGAGIAVLAQPVLGAPVLNVTGLLMPLAAAFAWAVGTVATKRWPPSGHRIVLTAWQLGLGAVTTGLGAWLTGERLPGVWPDAVLMALAFHVLIATALAYVLWYRLLAEQSATVAALTTLTVPVVGVLGAMALVGERPGAADWLGFALVLAGAALVVLRPNR